MSNHVQWDPLFDVANEVLNEQRKAILAQCNALSDCADSPAQDAEQRFRATLDALRSSAREHFATELAIFSSATYPGQDAYRMVKDEFEYLASDIITTDNFGMHEIQRFVALWWVGHLIDSARMLQALDSQ